MKNFISNFVLLCSLYTFVLFSLPAKAQFYSTGQDAATIKWKQTNSDKFQIIFPEGYETKAQILSNILDTVYSMDTQSLNAKPKKISLVLHTNTSNSNAYVAWAPRRIEFFTTPGQGTYAQPWLQQLSLHEYRHVVQISKMKQGLTKVLSVLLGQQAQPAVLGLYVPPWFLEGDAVCTETALSHSGRGRVPDFSMPIKAQLLEKGKFNYDKAVFGSYRDFVPDHYVLGYQLVAFGRWKYSPKIWDKSLNKVARRPYSITPFSNGIKENSGLNKTAFYRSALDSLRNIWKKQQLETRPNIFHSISTKYNKFHTDYRSPCLMENGELICVKSGMDDIKRIISIDENGKETRLFTPGTMLDNSISYADSKIIWAEYKNHPRWGSTSFSRIRLFDLRKQKSRFIGKGLHLFAPVFSRNGNCICAVNVSAQGNYSLMIFDSQNGNKQKEITSPENLFFQFPTWVKNDSAILSVVLGDEGKKIVLIDLQTSKIKKLTEYSYEEISHVSLQNDTLYFIGSKSGVSDLYAIDLKQNLRFRVFASEYGINDLKIAAKREKFLFSNYTENGYQAVSVGFEELIWENISTVKNQEPQLYKYIAEQENQILDKNSIDKKVYPIKKYSRLKNLFNFHSWAPVYLNVDDEELKPGFSIMSQNKLSTAFTTVGYEYDMNEGTGKYLLNFSYQGWFPIIDIDVDYGQRKIVFTDSTKTQRTARWSENNISTGLRLPLNLTRGKYFQLLQPGITLTQKYLIQDKTADATVFPGSLKTLDARLYYYLLLRKAQRDIIPKWGLLMDLNFRHAILEKKASDYIAASEITIYFPGFVRHQGFKMYAGWQRSGIKNYVFSSIINMPRGYHNIYAKELYSLKSDYVMPLLSPDFRLGSLLYLKRIEMSVFYDYAESDPKTYRYEYQSTGLEINTEMHILRLIAPVNLGMRTIYLPKDNTFKAEFLFAINFGALY
jgi:dipeptidyl peptidase IV (DPP IV)-like protein